jgi:hypothetical protein
MNKKMPIVVLLEVLVATGLNDSVKSEVLPGICTCLAILLLLLLFLALQDPHWVLIAKGGRIGEGALVSVMQTSKIAVVPWVQNP